MLRARTSTDNAAYLVLVGLPAALPPARGSLDTDCSRACPQLSLGRRGMLPADFAWLSERWKRYRCASSREGSELV